MTDSLLKEGLQSFIESYGKSYSIDPELITSEYVYRMCVRSSSDGDTTKTMNVVDGEDKIMSKDLKDAGGYYDWIEKAIDCLLPCLIRVMLFKKM